MKQIYLAGPMNGYPEKNHPAFHLAAKKLREVGFIVISPAEKPYEETDINTWQEALSYDVGECVCKSDGIAVLPGFNESKGGALEVLNAIALGKSVELIPGQPEAWRTRVLEWGRMTLAALWRDVKHSNYDQTHQNLAKVVTNARGFGSEYISDAQYKDAADGNTHRS
jgi:nucleoside 2-deoxyribosyltransferase